MEIDIIFLIFVAFHFTIQIWTENETQEMFPNYFFQHQYILHFLDHFWAKKGKKWKLSKLCLSMAAQFLKSRGDHGLPSLPYDGASVHARL